MIDAGALLFDMDGLLVDSEPLWFQVEREFARARGGDWTEAQAAACVGRGLANTLRVMGESFAFATNAERDVAEIIDAFIARAGELRLKPGAAELVAEAHGRIPIALASSSHRRLVDAILARFSLAARFGAVVSGDAVAHPKPAPDIFLLAAERLGVAPACCVVLEDSRAGVEAARAAGMRVIAVPEHDGAAFDGLADAVVGDLYAARRVLRFELTPSAP
jgi:mannitol-1-/sugar-/sorbitol-6-/2-deoxyglucose-6-phosphatase